MNLDLSDSSDEEGCALFAPSSKTGGKSKRSEGQGATIIPSTTRLNLIFMDEDDSDDDGFFLPKKSPSTTLKATTEKKARESGGDQIPSKMGLAPRTSSSSSTAFASSSPSTIMKARTAAIKCHPVKSSATAGDDSDASTTDREEIEQNGGGAISIHRKATSSNGVKPVENKKRPPEHHEEEEGDDTADDEEDHVAAVSRSTFSVKKRVTKHAPSSSPSRRTVGKKVASANGKAGKSSVTKGGGEGALWPYDPSAHDQHEPDLHGDDEDDELYPFFEDPLELGEEKPLLLGFEEVEDEGDPVQEAVPKSVNRYLQDHQKEGVKFMYDHYKAGKGCILGDEPGLGKTIQVIGLLLALSKKIGTMKDKSDLRSRKIALIRGNRETNPYNAVLIVVPASVADQWRKEIVKWGHFSVSVVRATQTTKVDTVKEVMELVRIGVQEIVVCSYETMRGRYAEALQSIKWRLVVFDEFHKAKTNTSETTEKARKLKARVKIGLTGTPVQNSLEELWCLLSLVAPDLVKTESEFKTYYSMPMKRSKKRTASDEVRERGEQRQVELNALLRKVLLQRGKDQIKHKLNGKQEYVVFCSLTDIQYKIYENVVRMPDFELLKHRKELCDCSRKDKKIRGECCYRLPIDHTIPKSSIFDPGTIDEKALIWLKSHPSREACKSCPSCIGLACIAKLQKIANHPCLLQYDPTTMDATKKEEVASFARGAFGPNLKELGGVERSQNFLTMVRTDCCGKLRTLAKLFHHMYHEEKAKVLVFSWSVQTLNVLEAFATSKGYNSRRLDGTVPGALRQSIIDEFDTDKSIFIFFISTKAGGLGLNLTSASRVIIFDVNWNPTHDLQAMDRSYRLGQQEEVKVYRLVSQGTIEELCYMRQIYKQQLSKLALQGNQSRVDGGEDDKNGEKPKGRVDKYNFDSVQGSKGEEGEVFGIENLLQLQKKSILATLRKDFGLEDEEEEKDGVVVTKARAVAHQVKEAGDQARELSNTESLDIETDAEQVLKMLGIKGNVLEQEESSPPSSPEKQKGVKEERKKKKRPKLEVEKQQQHDEEFGIDDEKKDIAGKDAPVKAKEQKVDLEGKRAVSPTGGGGAGSAVTSMREKKPPLFRPNYPKNKKK